MKKFLTLSLSDVAFMMLINVKMQTIISILTFMSRTNFALSLVEHGKKLYNLGPGFIVFPSVTETSLSCILIYKADMIKKSTISVQ